MLYNGDCIPFMATLRDNSIDLIITDPPYGMNYKSRGQGVDRRRSIITGEYTNVREPYFSEIYGDGSCNMSWIKEAYRILKEGSAIYVFTHWTNWTVCRSAAEFSGFKIKNMIVIAKSNHGSGDLEGAYAPKHELLLFATKGRHTLNFPDGRLTDVWTLPVKFSGAKRLHPNEKPVSWATPIIENSSKVGDTVFDPFMGSGTFGFCARALYRKFIGCEIDSDFFVAAKDRISGAVPGFDL